MTKQGEQLAWVRVPPDQGQQENADGFDLMCWLPIGDVPSLSNRMTIVTSGSAASLRPQLDVISVLNSKSSETSNFFVSSLMTDLSQDRTNLGEIRLRQACRGSGW